MTGIEVKETELLEWGPCSLRRPYDFDYCPSLNLRVAEDAARRIGFQVFESFEVPSGRETRRICEHALAALQPEYPQQRYSQSITHLAARLRDLFTEYRVLQPETRYTQSTGKIYISGRYTALSPAGSGKRSKEMYALRLRIARKGSSTPRRPDLLSLCRWFHLRSAETHAAEVKILNFVIGEDNSSWLEGPFDLQLVRNMIVGAADVYSRRMLEFPCPGEHCSSCLSLGCLPTSKG